MRAKLRHIKPELRKRMHDPVAQTGYFNYYAVPGPLAYPCSGTGCLCTGGTPYATAAKSARFPGHECLYWLNGGFRNQGCSIPTRRPASPPVIRNKNRMR